MFFGLWLTIHQLGFGVAGLLLGGLLQIFGYDGSADVQTESGIWGVRLAFGVVPGLFLIISALALMKYRITRERFEEARRGLLDTQADS